MSFPLATGVGAALIVIALVDVFLTVLYARMEVSLLTPRLYRATWSLMKAVSPRSRTRRDRFLSFAGPLMLVETLVLWGALLVVGFALISWPVLGSDIQASSGPTPTDFLSAVYYSGYAFTTLGTGDLVPQSSAYRLLMVFQAWVGFSVLTLILTYLMSVFSALVRRNTFAQTLHHLTSGTGQPAKLVSGLLTGQPDRGRGELATLGSGMLNLLESHHSYPVLHYFRMSDARYAMSRTAFVVMESATLIRSVLGPNFRPVRESAAVSLLWGSGSDLLEQTSKSLLKREAPNTARDDRSSFEAARRIFDIAGVESDSKEDALQAYSKMREPWFASVAAFAEQMAYDLSEIIPQRPND